MKKKVIGIAAGLTLLAAAGGYAGVGHYYASHFFPKTAINGLNCAGLTAEQVKEKIQKHIVDYTLSITERGGKTETLSGTEIGLTYVDDHAVENCWSPRILLHGLHSIGKRKKTRWRRTLSMTKKWCRKNCRRWKDFRRNSRKRRRMRI